MPVPPDAGNGGTGGMKRRLPTIRKGEVALAAISLPPLTDDANRHTPRPAHPGSAAAASKAAPIAASANRAGPAAGPLASPPSSAARAAAPPPQGARPVGTAAPGARHTPAPGETTPPGTPPPVRGKRGERGPPPSGAPQTPAPAVAAGGSIIAKEHGRTPAGDAQE